MRVVEPHEFKGVKESKRKQKRKLGLRFVLVAIAAVYLASVFLRPVPGVNATPTALEAQNGKAVTVQWPAKGQAAIGAVGYGVLSTHGEQTALPMASVAKVMTALAVLKQHPLQLGEQGPIITITQDDVDYYGKVVSEDGSNTPVVVGEEITQYEALQALLLPSSNNMAYTLARWAYGSEKEYIAYVNNFAKSLGMSSATFDDASGFSPKTAASAEDLARLAVNAMDNPVIAEIAAQKQATIPVAGTIYNVNRLLGYKGIVGLKTGNTEEAGGCFMAAAVRDIGGQKITAVSVIMGADNLGEALRDSVPLVTSVLDGFEPITLVTAGQTVGSYTVPWGASVAAVAKNDVSGVAWRDSVIKPDVTLNKLDVTARPISAGSEVGSVAASFGRERAESPVVLKQEVTQMPAFWRFKPRLL